MIRIRQYITVGFALVFLFSGMAGGYTRAMMAGARSIEVCAALGHTRIQLGANGEKLPRLDECACCFVGVAVVQGITPHVSRSRFAEMAVWYRAERALNTGDAIFSIWPRGPPVTV